MINKLNFNKWSREKIRLGKKVCTSRVSKKNDPSVEFVIQAPLWFIKKYLYSLEGADSPEEFEDVIVSIFGQFEPNRILYVHFGDFSCQKKY